MWFERVRKLAARLLLRPDDDTLLFMSESSPDVPDHAPPSAIPAEGGGVNDEGVGLYKRFSSGTVESKSVDKASERGTDGKGAFLVAVLVALPEELEHLQDILPKDMTLVDRPSGLGIRQYTQVIKDGSAEKPRDAEKFPSSGAVKHDLTEEVEVTYLFSTIGQMGELEMAYQTQAFYNELVEHHRTPHLMVLVGIAGAIKEVRLGDVVVADKVVRYLERSKILPDSEYSTVAVDETTPFTVQFDLDVFVADQRITNFLKTQFTVYDGTFTDWVKVCERDANDCIRPDQTWTTERKVRFQQSVDYLQKTDGIAFRPRVVIGAVASGPSVIASSRFKELLLKRHNRNYRACEMESGGFIFVIRKIELQENRRISFMVLRGVSDNSDESKSHTDSELAGRVRKMAMGNAIRVLFSLMNVPAFRSKLSMVRGAHNDASAGK